MATGDHEGRPRRPSVVVALSQICSQLQIRYAGFKTAGPHQIACWANRARQAAEIAAGAELIESARAHVLWTFLFTDAELAQLFNVSVHTIPDWKKIKWTETIRSLSGRQIGETFDEVRAMAPAARDVLFELLRDGPPIHRTYGARDTNWDTNLI